MIKRPSLGQAASLGALYDARSETFVNNMSLLNGQLPPDSVTRIDIPGSNTKVNLYDTYGEKFNSMNVGASLSASLLAGMVDVGRSGCYLAERRASSLVVQASLLHTLTTINEELNLAADGIEASLVCKSLHSGRATHVVTGITWGACNVVTAKRGLLRGEDFKEIEDRLLVQLQSLTVSSDLGEKGDFDNTFEVTVYGDVQAHDHLVLTDLISASQFLHSVSTYVVFYNNGKGQPLVYTKLPLPVVARGLKVEMQRQVTFHDLSDECSEKFIQVFDDLRRAQVGLSNYRRFLETHVDYIPRQHLLTVESRELEGKAFETRLKSKYARTLRAFRSGESDVQELWRLLEDYRTGAFALDRLSMDMRSYTEKVNFLQGIVNRGSQYVGFNGRSLDTALARSSSVNTYVLSFSEDAKFGSTEWGPNFPIVDEILDEIDDGASVLLKDCDAFNEKLTAPKLCLMRNSQIINSGFLRKRRFLEGDCIIRCRHAYLDRSRMAKPLERLPVRLPCPGSDCSGGEKHDWVCFRCDSIVEYGVADQFLYCNCGRCAREGWEFKCTDPRHGLDFKAYDTPRLTRLLSNLEPLEELNILVMGPTGVGKSTWINAFANYLTFSSLDDAVKAEKVPWVIPFSFRTYREKDGQFETINVRVGFEDEKGEAPMGHSSTCKLGTSEDEHDGSTGTSATQRTVIHRVQIGGLMVRLIDTPGVGDTRGPSKDQENMADILRALRQFDKLHGILILLKPNDQRLTLMFRFCIQELLAHLHRKAAQNIAFGFTNTRGTNYKPGDTLDPLRALLGQHREVGVGVHPHNVYCFDSESFRYLAALNQHGVQLGDGEENRRSWKHSVAESWKLLNYFKTLEPHQVHSTLNLNEIRHQIVKMTMPMAEIADAINASIKVNEDDIQELRHNEMTKKDLEAKLRIQITTVQLVKIDRPRTTCSHTDCVDYDQVGVEGTDGKPMLKTIYKTSCHAPCYLNDVTVDTIGHAGLRSCDAMGGGEICRVCNHQWINHLHVKYEVQHGTTTIIDPSIEETLTRNASARELKQKIIENKKVYIQKLRSEQEQITDAAAHFSVFLKRNSIIPYNDATLEYLDHQIEEETRKVSVGGSGDKLKSLKQYRSRYKEQIDFLGTYMAKGESYKLLDRHGVEKCLKRLCSLELHGESVKSVLKDEEPVVYREGPHIIRAKSNFTAKARERDASSNGSFAGAVAGVVLSLGGRVWSGLFRAPARDRYGRR